MPNASRTHEWFPVLLGVLLLLIAGAVLLRESQWNVVVPLSGRHATSTAQQGIPPAPSAAVQALLAQDPAFQYLVSFTGRAFEPSALAVLKGSVVRFTNNSSADLELEVGSSLPLLLHPREFTEHAFAEPGTVQYMDAHSSAAGTVHIAP